MSILFVEEDFVSIDVAARGIVRTRAPTGIPALLGSGLRRRSHDMRPTFYGIHAPDILRDRQSGDRTI